MISAATRHDEIRALLIRYLDALALGREIATTLLDFGQTDAQPVTAEALRECRRFVGEALARIESGETHATELWKVLEVERRTQANASRPAPLAERRRARRQTT